MDIHFNPPIHPGEMLREEFMVPLGLTAGALARALGVPRTRIERLVREETGLSPETADLLAKYFGSSTEFWLNMQNRYVLDCLRIDAGHMRARDAVTPLLRPDPEDAAA
jgi:addiction module HigA family antidote